MQSLSAPTQPCGAVRCGALNTKHLKKMSLTARRPPSSPAGAAQTSGSQAISMPLQGGRHTVEAFYEAYNTRDLDAIANLVAEDVLYHDLQYPDPHCGRGAVLKWLEKIRKYAPDDLRFCIEDITDGDPRKVGVKWHVECGDGITFPFSRGCSFIVLDDEGHILEVRDVVEPPTKPGDATLVLLGALTPLIRRLGPAADPDNLKRLPLASAALWALIAGYFSLVMFSKDLPGAPGIATPPDVLIEVFTESLNIFWINTALDAVGLTPVPAIPSPPVSESVFNFVLAWAAMFLPFILTDGPSKKVKNKVAWYTSIMILTNFFFIPFMALRAAPEPEEPSSQQLSTASTSNGSHAGSRSATTPSSSKARSRRQPFPTPGAQALPGWSTAMGAFGIVMLAIAIPWALFGRGPEYGDFAARWQYALEAASTNRVLWAFGVDLVFFYMWQLTFMQATPAVYRFTPYVGMAAWMLSPQSKQDRSD